jgi:small-conductance mechanosensitive channel
MSIENVRSALSRPLIALLLCLLATGADAGAAVNETAGQGRPAALILLNRTIFIFRSALLEVPPEARARRAQLVIEDAVEHGAALIVDTKRHDADWLVMVDEKLAFVVTPADLDPANGLDTAQTARDAASLLRKTLQEMGEARSGEFLLKSLLACAAATGLLILFLKFMLTIRRKTANSLAARSNRTNQNGTGLSARFIGRQYFFITLTFLARLILAAVMLLAFYEWLSFVLLRFPYTRPWGEELHASFLQALRTALDSIAGALPGIGVAIVIFMFARFVLQMMHRVLGQIAGSARHPVWLSPETLSTTRWLASALVWLFAVAMAYPYLPGAQTEAFKGLSVLLGLMISLGSTSLVGQGAAGLILTYTRTFRTGEYVRIGEHEGTVVATGIFTTCIQTGLGEELMIPNSLIVGTVTKNYSRTVRGTGYVIDTTVTIGYDTPWRQVHAMLIEAARKTPGILASPEPQVFQTALSDYYPEYRLVAQAIPSSPRPRAEVLSLLHANIQDVFNQYGVQIMSPHYMSDPSDPKLVSAGDWHKSPAQAPIAAANPESPASSKPTDP